jgi:hypothetical protein
VKALSLNPSTAKKKKNQLDEGLMNAENVLSLFLCGTGALTQDLHLKPLYLPFFMMGFFEIGSSELFSQAGFKL